MITSDTKEIDSIIADTLGKLVALCDRMVVIVAQATSPPEAAWLEALTKHGTELHATLGELLGIGEPPGLPVAEAISFVCTQLEQTFERLGAWQERGCPAGEI